MIILIKEQNFCIYNKNKLRKGNLPAGKSHKGYIDKGNFLDFLILVRTSCLGSLLWICLAFFLDSRVSPLPVLVMVGFLSIHVCFFRDIHLSLALLGLCSTKTLC